MRTSLCCSRGCQVVRGHLIVAPCREFGFGYLEALRTVSTAAAEPHLDLIPEDVGLGPYDTPCRTWQC